MGGLDRSLRGGSRWLDSGRSPRRGAGAITAKVVDFGVPDEWVAWFREAVEAGTTTVVLLLTEVNMNALVDEVARFAGAHLVYANLDALSFDRISAALSGSHPAPANESAT